MIVIENSCIINASSKRVWQCLTQPLLMQRWLGEEEMNVEVITSWEPGGAIVIKGFHHVAFEVKGQVKVFRPFTELSYTHLSSVSNMKDTPENYTVIRFFLQQLPNGTELKVTLSNFATDSIYRHLKLYWSTTLNYIKVLAEE